MTHRLIRRPRSTALVACSTVLALWLTGHAAQAAGARVSDATPTQIREALKHFKAGGLAVGKRDLTLAIVEYRASLDIIDSPNSRLELARVLKDNGQLVDAWTEYGRTIDDAKALAVSEARYAKTADAAALERGEFESKIAIVTVTVEDAPPGATVRIGAAVVPSESWGKAFPVAPVAQGSVDVVLLADGVEVARQPVQADAGRRAAVTIGRPKPPVPSTMATLPEGPEAQPHSEFESEPTAPAGTAAPSSANKLRPFAYVAGGVGVAGIATFVISGTLSHSAFNDLQSTCHGVCPPGHEGEISSGRTEQTVANVGLVIGALGVASGVGLFILSLPHAQQANTAVVVGPGWLGVRGSL